MTVLVTGGLVAVEDGAKAAEEYAPARKVRIELKFDVAEGTDGGEALDLVIEMANDRINAELGRGAAVTRVVETARDAAPGEQQAPKRTRRTKEQIEADKRAAEAPAADPAAITDDPTTPATEAGTATSSASSEADPAAISGDEWDVAPETPAAAEVTDADLNAAVQARNGELNDPPKIRALIGSYNPDPTKPFQLRQIPAAQRADFLAKLKALK